MGIISDLVKSGTGTAADTAGGVAKSVVSGITSLATGLAAGMWKMAFGAETGAIVDPIANAANTVASGGANALIDGAGGIAKGLTNAAVDGFAALGDLPAPPIPGAQGAGKGR